LIKKKLLGRHYMAAFLLPPCKMNYLKLILIHTKTPHPKTMKKIIVLSFISTIALTACLGRNSQPAEKPINSEPQAVEQVTQVEIDAQLKSVDKIINSGKIADCDSVDDPNFADQCRTNIILNSAKESNEPTVCDQLDSELVPYCKAQIVNNK